MGEPEAQGGTLVTLEWEDLSHVVGFASYRARAHSPPHPCTPAYSALPHPPPRCPPRVVSEVSGLFLAPGWAALWSDNRRP